MVIRFTTTYLRDILYVDFYIFSYIAFNYSHALIKLKQI